MEIIDSHHHLWSAQSGNYAWLQPENSVELLWGRSEEIPSEYLIADLREDARNQNLVKSVHVQCGYNASRPVAETEWLQSLADAPGSGGFPHGIVAFADFWRSDVEKVLAGHRAFANTRGIRQMLNRHKNPGWNMSERDYLADDTWRKNFGLLKKYSLSFDLQLYYQQMDAAVSLARENPNVLFILNHTGMPADRDKESLRAWRRAMRRFSECENGVTKISGLGMCEPKWTRESIRPFVLAAIEDFGVERCMFASNFPVDRKFSSYDAVWEAYNAITRDFSASERRGLFRDNAERFYRL